MKAIWNNRVIAESDDTIVVENNHYFPNCQPCGLAAREEINRLI